MIFTILVPLLWTLSSLAATATQCPLNLSWEIKTEGLLATKDVSGATDFIFLTNDQILVSSFPAKDKEQAPLQIYNRTKDGWRFDVKASSKLPLTYHAHQMILADLDGDNVKEVIIADHGTDKPPYPGSHPFILKKKNGDWTFDPSSKSLGSDFTFNVAVLNSQGINAIYKANVAGKTPVLYSFEKNGKWQDITPTLPKELAPHQLCFMTALAEDFDKNGINDLYLGGCDRDKIIPEQTHDRILSLQKDKWALQPASTIPARKMDSKWGTVFVKTTDLNADNKPDILLATHDYGFHSWKVVIYENLSVPGKFKFQELNVPLAQEANTEGYVNSLEDFKIEGLGLGILAEVRSVIRDQKKTFPVKAMRLIVQDKKKYIDISGCIPERISSGPFLMKKFPNDPQRILLVPYQGEILSLRVSKK